MTITAATKWNSNAEMILDIVEVGYIKPTDSVMHSPSATPSCA